jgi:hypothetical protein
MSRAHSVGGYTNLSAVSGQDPISAYSYSGGGRGWWGGWRKKSGKGSGPRRWS